MHNATDAGAAIEFCRALPGLGLRRLRATLVLTCLLVLAAHPAGAEFKLLESVKETRIGSIEKFVAAEAFRIGSRIGGRTLSAIGLNFTQHFLGIVETGVPAISLSGWTLRYTTGDKSLIKALGGEHEAAVPYLAYVHRLMEMGEEGGGHTDWRSNFAYLRSSIDGRLWAVHWSVNYANEWTIGAVHVPHSHLDWRSGSRLFGSAVTCITDSCTSRHWARPPAPS
jgi:hypothetical protein